MIARLAKGASHFHARHGFIYADLRFLPGIDVQGHRIEYNDAATRDSIEQVRSFLQRTLSHD
jgi:dienelactone hydrolase